MIRHRSRATWSSPAGVKEAHRNPSFLAGDCLVFNIKSSPTLKKVLAVLKAVKMRLSVEPGEHATAGEALPPMIPATR